MRRQEHDYEKEILVFVEFFDRLGGYILLDFVDSGYFSSFISLLGREVSGSSPSMIYITNYRGKRISADTIYVIERKTIETIISQKLITVDDESLLFGYRLDLINTEISLFSRSFTSKNSDFFETFNFQNTSKFAFPDLKGKVIAKIRNVGQANWNELYIDEKCEIIYDIGAPLHASRSDVIRLIGDRETIIIRDNPCLIISHWDVDHYHSLLALSDDAIRAFSYVIYRNKFPTKTSQVIRDRLVSLLPAHRIISLNSATFLEVTGRHMATDEELKILKKTSPLVVWNRSSDKLLLFNAYEHKDRNRNGIALIVRALNTSILLTGDLHYFQVSTHMLPCVEYTSTNHLVVPHHGGKAGTFEYKRKYKCKSGDAVVSVGKNPYRPPHPNEDNIRNLNAAGFKTLRTDHLGSDYSISLT